RAIATAHARLAAAPRDSQGLLDLARAFLQKVRETGDPTLYSKAGGILHDLARRTPDDLGVLVTQGTLDLALHRFGEARRVGRRAVRLFPDSPEARGVLVDADNELGLYAEAGAQTQAMADLRPDLASLSRASYARELRGDLPGAIQAMSAAVEAGGGGGGENVAYVQAQLATLLLTSGDTSGAEAAYASAERSFPGFASARAGRAAVLVARGQPGQAADALEGVVRDQPLALYRTARLDEAARESDRALSLGSRDPLLNFHAAAISAARGDRAEAASRLGVVLAANPRMSAGSAADVAALAGRLGLPLPGPR